MPQNTMSSHQGQHEIESARNRLTSAQTQLTSATKVLNAATSVMDTATRSQQAAKSLDLDYAEQRFVSAEVMMAARFMVDEAERNMDVAKEAVMDAEEGVKVAEERWHATDVDDAVESEADREWAKVVPVDAVSSSDAANPKIKRRRVSVSPPPGKLDGLRMPENTRSVSENTGLYDPLPLSASMDLSMEYDSSASSWELESWEDEGEGTSDEGGKTKEEEGVRSEEWMAMARHIIMGRL